MTLPAQSYPADIQAGRRSPAPDHPVRHGSGRTLKAVPAPPYAPPKNPKRSLRDCVEHLATQRRLAETDVEQRADERHRARGKLTARERIDLLLDAGSFVELNLFVRHRATGFGMERLRPSGDGVISGWGTIDGRTVFVYAHDARVFGGALGETFAEKIHHVMDLAESMGAPIIGLNDGGGARIQEGVTALAGFGGVFRRNVRASGVIPQISLIQGACAGGAAYSPALTDYVFMVKDTANIYITGPDVVRAVTGEEITHEELGGSRTHTERTGVAAFVADDEESAISDVRYLLSFLPSNNKEMPPVFAAGDDPERGCEELLDIVPAEERTPYDMRAVIEVIVDDGDFLEVHEAWARNIVCAFGRIDGHVVGVVGNQPSVLAGALDIDASEKAARFVRTCDAFNIPIITLVDVPGFLPGTQQEHSGIVRRGAKLLYAYCEATVPRIQVIVRKAFGGAYIVMDSKSIGSDLSLAWPSNQIAVMGADGAADIIFRREIAAANDPSRRRAELVEDYSQALLNPYVAAERGLVDDVIDPVDTRRVLVKALAMLRNKRGESPTRKHGNIPL